MEQSTEIKFAGDVSIDKVKVISSKGFFQDITAQVITVQYFEDIFSPFITGTLIVKDALDLLNLFPFVGEEFVELEISTPTLEDKSLKGTYYIYKMTDREIIGDREVIYQLHFISVEAIVDINKKMSKVYKGKVSDIVTGLLKDSLDGLETKKQFYVEETINNTKFISNFWSPVKNIMMCAKQAVNKNNVPNYVFFENRDGFYFISLDALYGAGIMSEFILDKYTRDDLPGGGSTRNIQEDYKRIQELSIPVAFDYVDRIRSGMLSSRAHSFDATKKTYVARNYNVFQKFDKQNHLNPNPLNSSSAIFKNNSAIVNIPRMYDSFSGWGDVTNFKTLQERVSQMQLATAHQIEIVVPGRTDYTVGQKVKITLNKMEPVSSDDIDITDKMFSGNYLISALNHVINREKHECTMELIKDSLQADVNKVGSK
jgi:hypothetical protein